MITIAYVNYSEVLQHEGILGMKWGQRNGPPYPLKDGAHSAAEKKANPSLARRAANAAANAITKVRKVSQGNGHARYSRNPRKLSDEELKTRIERLKREAEYEKLLGVRTREQRQAIAIKRGENFATALGAALGKRAGALGTRLGKHVDDLATDVLNVPKALIGDLHDLGLDAIKGHKPGQKYENKLASAKSEKAYEDWMLENNPGYAQDALRKQIAKAERQQRLEARKEERQYRKDSKNLVKLQSQLENYRHDRAQKQSSFAGYKQLQRSDFEAPMYNGKAFMDRYMNEPELANDYMSIWNYTSKS